MITIDVVGDAQIVARIDAMPGRLMQQLTARFTKLAVQMQGTIKQKLSGQVLNARSGRLRDSIDYRVTSAPSEVQAVVFSNSDVKYGRIHEFGGVTSPHVIEPKNGDVLAFMIGGRQVFARRVNHPGSRIPARPFMRPTLAEYRERITQAAHDAVAESLKS